MYKEITVLTTTEGADLVADAFFGFGVSGVKIIDSTDVFELQEKGISWDYIDDSLLFNRGEPVKVSAFFDTDNVEKIVTELEAMLKSYGELTRGFSICVSDYKIVDWLQEWKKYYKPIEVGRFLIVPEWTKTEIPENKIPIIINPSMAFGTGEHESTRLCLEFLSETQIKGKNIIDVGTGSGILGIGASMLSPSAVFMCDLDGQSVKSAKENAELNNVADKVEIKQCDLTSGTDKVFDVMLANLTADILIRLVAEIPQRLIKGGIVIASGIICQRADEVIKAFENAGLTVAARKTSGEWEAVKFIYS